MLTLDEKEARKLQTDVNDWAETQRAEHREYTDMFQLPPPVLPAVPIEDNFIARPVPLDGEKHPFMTRAGTCTYVWHVVCVYMCVSVYACAWVFVRVFVHVCVYVRASL